MKNVPSKASHTERGPHGQHIWVCLSLVGMTHNSSHIASHCCSSVKCPLGKNAGSHMWALLLSETWGQQCGWMLFRRLTSNTFSAKPAQPVQLTAWCQAPRGPAAGRKRRFLESQPLRTFPLTWGAGSSPDGDTGIVTHPAWGHRFLL